MHGPDRHNTPILLIIPIHIMYNYVYILCIIDNIIIIFINCDWVVTRWQLLFYMYTKYEIGY